MANITKEERERRAALAAQDSHPDGNADTASPEASIPQQAPEPASAPVSIEKNIFNVTEQEYVRVLETKMAEEKQVSLDAIEAAVADARKAAESKVRSNPVTMALVADPANIGKRVDFLRKFNPSNNAPPRPAPTPWGIKDEADMRWCARYAPEEFLDHHFNGSSKVAKDLLRTIPNEVVTAWKEKQASKKSA